jgi:hypothetical protein
MINNFDEIEKNIVIISNILCSMQDISLKQAKIIKIRLDILNLLEDTVHYLHNLAPLTPWQISHIVDTINGLYWGWLHYALNAIKLTIIDKNEISPDIIYKQEIKNLNFADLEKQILLLKEFLHMNHKIVPDK